MRSDQPGTRDVTRDPSRISCQEWTARDGSVRTDQKIRKDRLSQTASRPVAGMGVTGEKSGRERNLLDDSH